MSKISLRDYLSEIDQLIDQGQIGPAIDHCRHILATFPKHIDSYRLMGKAYLEDKHYQEAGDIFQRVLSSVPDDFVSHVGMSIIRESEENQDAAIWHMERAFEAQPSNRAVQDELRRLYGEREGRAPAKVRLTRGALARMYAHGDLFNQAISELLQALENNAERPDLQVLLAEMYFNTGQNSEAASACQEVLDKLPYCLYANHLMADILKQSDREAEAEAYLQKVAELDPYASLLDSKSDAAAVAAESVTLEKRAAEEEKLGDTEPHSIQPEQPMDEPAVAAPENDVLEKEELPDWLSSETEQKDESLESLFEESEQEESPAEAEQFQDSDDALDKLEALSPFESEQEDQEIQQEPSASQPATPHEAFPSGEHSGEDELPEWLKELRPDAGEAEEATPESPLAGEAEEAAPAPAFEDPEEDSTPEWLADNEDDRAEEDDEDLPEWLQNMASEEQDGMQSGTASLPAFGEGTEEEPEPSAAIEEPSKTEDESGAFGEGAEEDPEPSAAVEEASTGLSDEEEQEGISWLEGLAAEQGADEEEMTTAPEDRSEQAPAWTGAADEEGDADDDSLSWLDDMVEESDSSEQPESGEVADKSPDQSSQEPQSEASSENVEGLLAASGETTPEWLRDLAEEAEESPPAPKPETSSLEDPPDWLDDLRSSEEDAEAAAYEEAGEIENGQAQDRLDDLASTESAEEPGELEEVQPDDMPADQSSVEDESSEDEEFEDIQVENMDWLDKLGADEEDSAMDLQQEDLEASADSQPEEQASSDTPVERVPEEELPASEWVPEENIEPEPDLPAFDSAPQDQPSIQADEQEMPAAEAVAAIRSEAEPESKAEKKKKDRQAQAVERLESARQALNYDNLEEAAEQYSKLVRSRRMLDEVIADLQAAIQRHPRSVALRQALGDAYMRSDRLRDALESYTRAEDLL